MTDLCEADATDLRPLSYARMHWVPRDEYGRIVSAPTMYRWARRGVCGEKLDVLYTPQGAATTQASVIDFLRRVDAARRAEFEPVKPENYAADDAQMAAAGL